LKKKRLTSLIARQWDDYYMTLLDFCFKIIVLLVSDNVNILQQRAV